ncbi:unnamed protein product [Trichogramma brassicae]|uniref:Uncharacterized protein n=1 Tax=Trichogramma brassicae TaxID=86971 RepID=A0A6H5ILW2_9HYME|nr:unnamed protein product [Trichogramma brassicae]
MLNPYFHKVDIPVLKEMKTLFSNWQIDRSTSEAARYARSRHQRSRVYHKIQAEKYIFASLCIKKGGEEEVEEKEDEETTGRPRSSSWTSSFGAYPRRGASSARARSGLGHHWPGVIDASRQSSRVRARAHPHTHTDSRSQYPSRSSTHAAAAATAAGAAVFRRKPESSSSSPSRALPPEDTREKKIATATAAAVRAGVERLVTASQRSRGPALLAPDTRVTFIYIALRRAAAARDREKKTERKNES